MLDGGVSLSVIRTFVENATSVFDLTASDIVTLKQRGVPDDITNAMLTRTGQLRAQASQVAASQATPNPNVPLRIVPTYNGFDPDSYAYFCHYYLHPRTLASVYQRLGVYAAPYPGGYGYNQPFGYGPVRWAP
jgi:hypothetical protein